MENNEKEIVIEENASFGLSEFKSVFEMKEFTDSKDINAYTNWIFIAKNPLVTVNENYKGKIRFFAFAEAACSAEEDSNKVTVGLISFMKSSRIGSLNKALNGNLAEFAVTRNCRKSLNILKNLNFEIRSEGELNNKVPSETKESAIIKEQEELILLRSLVLDEETQSLKLKIVDLYFKQPILCRKHKDYIQYLFAEYATCISEKK
jgi:hypothetical protein